MRKMMTNATTTRRMGPGRTAILAAAAVAMGIGSGITGGCGSAQRDATPQTNPEAEGRVTVNGILRSGYVGIGGEHTGWMIQPGGGQPPIEVNIVAVQDQANQLDGMSVTATGKYTEKKYVERGPTQILIVEELKRAGGGW